VRRQRRTASSSVWGDTTQQGLLQRAPSTREAGDLPGLMKATKGECGIFPPDGFFHISDFGDSWYGSRFARANESASSHSYARCVV
jgi:hypothetical protein